MLELVLAIIILLLVIWYVSSREGYWSCRDCPSDAQWPTFTTQDITVLNPFIWPYSALPTFKGMNEKFTGDKLSNGTQIAVEEHFIPPPRPEVGPFNDTMSQTKSDRMCTKPIPVPKPTEQLRPEPDHVLCIA